MSQSSTETTAADLWRALQAGLLLPTNQIYKFYQADDAKLKTQNSKLKTQNCLYRFLHDRVQQAAYGLIPDDHKQITHLQIGRLLQQATPVNEREENIFALVNHLNQGAALMVDELEQQELVQLNLAAGQKARSATAYGAALDYFKLGMALLKDDCWQEQYELTLALYEGATNSAYLNTDFEQMQQLAEVVLHQARSWLDRVNTYEAKIQVCVAQNQLLQALQLAREVLEQLGVSLPAQPTPADVKQALQQTQALLGDRSVESLLELPAMTAPDKQAAMVILASIGSAAYQAAPDLFPLIVFAQVNLSVQYGNAPKSTFGYVQYGLMRIALLKDIDAGYRFGQLGLNLLQRLNASQVAAKTVFGFNSFLRHWQEPAKATLSGFLQAYANGLETGDLEHVALSLMCYSYTAYFSGQELSTLRQTMEDHRQVMQQFRQDIYLRIQGISYQAVLNLLEPTAEPERLCSEHYDEDEMIQLHLEANQLLVLCQIYLNKLLLSYLFQRYEQALLNARLSEQYLGAAAGLLHIPLFSFYDALVRLAVYPSASETEQTSILNRVAVHQEKLKEWAVHAPSNQAHRCALVAAERCRILGEKAEAIDLYDRAISLANEHEYLNEAAIANELAAKFYLEWGKERIAQEYLIEAYYSYARWGAKAKVVDLETRYPDLLAPILRPSRSALSVNDTIFTSETLTSTMPFSSNMLDALDLAAILKASQTLSQEIELGQLLSTLLQLIIKNAGADKCVLLLLQDEHLFVKGLATVGAAPVVLPGLPLEESQDIPHQMIYRVKNRLEPVVLLDVTARTEFVTDPYFRRQQPKSILCSPILHQGKLLGIVYLENKLTLGAFTNERVHLLNLLCAQAAISLENAQLYQRSQDYAQELEQSLFQLRASEARFQKLAANLPGTIYQLRIAPDGSVSTPYISSGCATLYEVPPEDFLTGIKDFRSMEHPDDHSSITQAILHSAQTLTPFEHELRIVTPSGRVKWIQVASRPERQADGSMVWEGVKMDISDRKAAELAIQQKTEALEQTLQELQQAQLQIVQSEKMSALGNLVAGVAHEINNPVGFIAGNLQPALEHVKDTFGLLALYQQEYPHPSAVIQDEIETIDLEYVREDLPKLIGSMKLGVERIRSISTSLRTFSRADKDHKVPFNIHEGIDSTILILKHRLKANGARPAIEVVTDYGSIPVIECFPGQLNQVFMNILANAIDALEESNQRRSFADIQANPNRIAIQTRLTEARKHITICITDHGVGMTEEVKRRVFDHLFTTKAVGQGTGLGLAIANQIVVEKHGGEIEVNSTLGKGTEFVITLPVKANAALHP